jgi:chlorobactene glucosyltransferase
MDVIYLFNIFILTCLILVTSIWCYIICIWLRSIENSPKLIEGRNKQLHDYPKVSIILPAKNEQNYIKKSIQSILNQDYPNYELILINDGSQDKTLDIMKEFSEKENKIKVIDLDYKPEGWVGKNWACYNGYLQSSGEILLFTDADTYHRADTLSLSILYFFKHKLDTLNVLPRTIGDTFVSKLILPLYTLHQHTFCSPVYTNDPDSKKKNAYFLGIYYLLKRDAYEKIGTHKAVREEFHEDTVIGKKLRNLGFRVHTIRGEHNLYTETLRSSSHIFNQISRVIIPYYRVNKLIALRLTIFLFSIEFVPAFLLLYSIITYQLSRGNLFPEMISLILSVISVSIMVIVSSLQMKYGLYQNPWYGLGAPIGACIYSFAYLFALFKAIGKSNVGWREQVV